MNSHKFILSSETKIIDQEVVLSGFVHSCRNLGSVIFFLIEDAYGTIQVVWQKTVLDSKVSDCLIGKKIYVQGQARLREQKATSTYKVNDVVEIDAQNCFIVDNQMRSYSLLSDSQIITTLLENKKQDLFIKKQKNFDQGVFKFQLFLKLREFLLKNKFIEIPFFLNKEISKTPSYNNQILDENALEKNGFERNFFFLQTPTEKINIKFPAYNLSQSLSISNQILNMILTFNGVAETVKSSSIISFQDVLKKYGLEEPDFRFSFSITQAQNIFEETTCNLNPFLEETYCLLIPNIGVSLLTLEKIIEHVRQKTGLTISYMTKLIQQEGFHLKKNIKNLLFKKNVAIFLASHGFKYAQIAFSSVYEYLRQNKLCLEKEHAGKWIYRSENKQNFELISCHFVLNGVAIASLNYENHLISVFNKASVSINLSLSASNLELGQGSGTLNKISFYTPAEIISPNLAQSKDLELEILANDEYEKNQIIELLNLKKSSNYVLWEKISAIQPLLSQFDMEEKNAKFLLDLLPEKVITILESQESYIFQFLWSLLGNKHVVNFLADSTAKKILQTICSLELITDYKQLLFLDLRTIYTIDSILKNQTLSQIVSIKIIKVLLNSAPNDLSNLIICLENLINSKSVQDEKKIITTLLTISRLRLSTFGFYNYYIQHYKNENLITLFCSTIRSFYTEILQNKKVDESEILYKFQEKLKSVKLDFSISQDTFLEIIYYFYRPLNMDFLSFKAYYSFVVDQVDFFDNNGIKFSGKNWEELEKCYFFCTNQFYLRLYPSKNCPSFFAKASCGICTGFDFDLFHRNDHFHLNLVEPNHQAVVGNVQVYLIHNFEKKVMFVRGLNPSASYLSVKNMDFVINSILETVTQIAIGSDFDQILLCPSLGIWHVESSRKEVIGALRSLYKTLGRIDLEKPFLLFHFAKQDKTVDHGYLLWGK